MSAQVIPFPQRHNKPMLTREQKLRTLAELNRELAEVYFRLAQGERVK